MDYNNNNYVSLRNGFPSSGMTCSPRGKSRPSRRCLTPTCTGCLPRGGRWAVCFVCLVWVFIENHRRNHLTCKPAFVLHLCVFPGMSNCSLQLAMFPFFRRASAKDRTCPCQTQWVEQLALPESCLSRHQTACRGSWRGQSCRKHTPNR